MGNVLYINADTADETLYQRFIDVHQLNSLQDKGISSIDILSFKNRYRQNTVDELVNTIMDTIGDQKYSLIIIDSLDYFVSFEHSHNGSTFGPVINQALDLIASQTGASIAFTLKDDYSHVFEGLCDTYMELVLVSSERLKAARIDQGDYYQVSIKSSVLLQRSHPQAQGILQQIKANKVRRLLGLDLPAN